MRCLRLETYLGMDVRCGRAEGFELDVLTKRILEGGQQRKIFGFECTLKCKISYLVCKKGK